MENVVKLGFKKGMMFVTYSSFFFKRFFFYLSPSTYYVFLKKKKKFKKTKTCKLIMTKHLRKMLLLLNVNNLTLKLKGQVFFLSSFFKTLQKPLLVLFKSLLNTRKINDIFLNKVFTFNFIIYRNTIPYCFIKDKRKRRLKRKIVKKMFSKNQIKV